MAVNSASGTDKDGLDMCSVTIQFDHNTKKLFHDLHYPYGSYTSFFRHLILLEKYWRSGDLALSENASQKGSIYVRSVTNRIDAYEAKHKRSDADLSACTRPDLTVPSAPQLLHMPAPLVIEAPTTRRRSSQEREAGAGQNANNAGSASTILRIPSVSMPAAGSSGASASPAMSPPGMPTKIRVRNDLMHLGLVAKQSTSDANIMERTKRAIADKPPQQLMQLLNEPTLKKAKLGSSISSGGGPTLGNTSLVGPSPSSGTKSSNSQLFKNTESTSSSAIPLTFNNSIAEVLAAANKAKKKQDPELTITAKTVSKSHDKTTNWPASVVQPSSAFTSTSSATASIGSAGTGLTIQSSGGASGQKVNPLMDMSKLLQTQAPGIPPHIVAQSTLPAASGGGGGLGKPSQQQMSTHQLAGSMPKIAPKPPSNLIKPVPLNKVNQAAAAASAASSAAQQQHKKSLNNVLDRLSGFKSTSPAAATKPTASISSGASSLLQQLQAPPMMSSAGLPSAKSVATTKTSTSSAATAASAAAAAAAGLTSQQLQQLNNSLMTSLGFPGSGLVGQPMVQYPTAWAQAAATSNAAAANQAAASQAAALNQAALQAQQAAQAALLMAGAGMPGMNPAAAKAAMEELVKISLQQQAAKSATSAGQAQSRMRAPPPLTHMGRTGGSGQKKPDGT